MIDDSAFMREPAATLTTIACGVYFLTALVTGVWKWRAMVTSPDHQAPFYVDTAHRASLLYSFACLVLLLFLASSPFSATVNLLAAAAPLAFFAIAIATYIVLGLQDRTDNQFATPSRTTHVAMVLLACAEIGGFAVLFVGYLIHRFA